MCDHPCASHPLPPTPPPLHAQDDDGEAGIPPWCLFVGALALIVPAVYFGYADFEPESKAVPEGPGRGFGNHLGWMSMEAGLAAANIDAGVIFLLIYL